MHFAIIYSILFNTKLHYALLILEVCTENKVESNFTAIVTTLFRFYLKKQTNISSAYVIQCIVGIGQTTKLLTEFVKLTLR